MKNKATGDGPAPCRECASAFRELILYRINPEQAKTVAGGIRMAMRGTQIAFQEVSFQLAHMTALGARALRVLTGRGMDDHLIDHLMRAGVRLEISKEVIPPNNCVGAQVHVYCNAWLRLNELVQLDPRENSIERLELQLLQQLMNFYERGAFPQLERSRDAQDVG